MEKKTESCNLFVKTSWLDVSLKVALKYVLYFVCMKSASSSLILLHRSLKFYSGEGRLRGFLGQL